MIKKPPKTLPIEMEYDIKSIQEEHYNMISHGVGILGFLILSPFLIVYAFSTGNGWYLIGSIIYCISLLMVYTSSTLYHSVYTDPLRKRLRILDHISIYFLIAGSYTPFIFTHFRDPRGWTILVILWGMTLLGSILKLYFTHKYKIVSTVAYIVMGWMAIFIIEPLMITVSSDCFMWIGIGGAFYTTGVIFYLWESLYQNHFIWHLFVLGGSISHFIAIYLII